MRAFALSLIIALWALPSPRALAQQAGAGDATAPGTEQSKPPFERDLTSATETVVDAVDPTGGAHRGSIASGEYDGLAAGDTDAAAAPARAASTDVRRAGPPGAPALLTVRGGEPRHTRTTLAGIPLDGAYDGGFNLATLPAPLLGEFRLYRSNVPLHLGPPGLGGVLALELADDEQTGFAIGAGSWRRHRVAAMATRSTERTTTSVGAVLQGAQNRFRYFDDNGTPFSTDDDRTRRRQNAGVEQATAVALQRWQTSERQVDIFLLAGAAERGISGLGRVETRSASLSEARGDLGLRVAGERRGRAQMNTLAWLSAGTRTFRDPLREFSARRSATTEDRAVRVGVSAQPLVTHNRQLRSRWLLEVEAQRWSATRGEVPGRSGASRLRLGSGGEIAAAVHPRVSAGLTLRLDLVRDSDETQTDWVALPAPQAGVSFRLVESLRSAVDLSFTAAFVSRAPSFSERFADVGQSIGNPDLRAESRAGADVAVALTSRVGALRVDALVGGYGRRARDLIVFVETGSGARRAENVATADLMGLEGELSLTAWGAVRLRADYTAQSARDASSKTRLPYRADHQGSVALGAFGRGLDAELALDGMSFRSVDRQDASRVPRRVTVDAELGYDPERWRGWGFGVSAHNIADQRSEFVALRDGGESRRARRAIADFVGSPLPGRSLFVTLRYAANR